MTLKLRPLPRGLVLKHGSHLSPDDGFCVMEAVAYVAGQPHSDHPACACPVITAFLRSWNDSLPDDETRTRLLKPLIRKVAGTKATKAIELARVIECVDWVCREFTPAWLELAPALKPHAEALRAFKPIQSLDDLDAIMSPLRAAQKDSAASWDATRDATRDATWDATRVAAWDAAWDASWGEAAWKAARAASRAASWDASWGDATWDAARDATWDATRDAARAASWDASWGDATRDAAWVAAREAARDAAWVASWDAAWEASWGAAWVAARDAAWVAAWDASWGEAAWKAARAAAWDAARDATWDAARDAAWDAARVAARAALKPTTEKLQQSAVNLVKRMAAIN